MLAMQYGFVLPADYDMGVIRRRIAENGPLLDDFPHLVFKAYLSAEKNAAALPSRANLYAPFYLWGGSGGMSDFLCGNGFAGLVQAFGWPSVSTWAVWQAKLSPGLARASVATRELLHIPAYAALGELRERECALALEHFEAGALAAVSAFDPAAWTLVRFRLWDGVPDVPEGADIQLYAVGHVSAPVR
ncbi:MAG: DUF4865 family protein [Acidihalobacter sp.]|uniref:DUF4865 family protein n=1 Tax=Acidihalobacter sp. TaxID=1872108 RepID=UPI00307DE4C1